jgi:hypothetical protein
MSEPASRWICRLCHLVRSTKLEKSGRAKMAGVFRTFVHVQMAGQEEAGFGGQGSKFGGGDRSHGEGRELVRRKCFADLDSILLLTAWD